MLISLSHEAILDGVSALSSPRRDPTLMGSKQEFGSKLELKQLSSVPVSFPPIRCDIDTREQYIAVYC